MQARVRQLIADALIRVEQQPARAPSPTWARKLSARNALRQFADAYRVAPARRVEGTQTAMRLIDEGFSSTWAIYCGQRVILGRPYPDRNPGPSAVLV